MVHVQQAGIGADERSRMMGRRGIAEERGEGVRSRGERGSRLGAEERRVVGGERALGERDQRREGGCQGMGKIDK